MRRKCLRCKKAKSISLFYVIPTGTSRICKCCRIKQAQERRRAIRRGRWRPSRGSKSWVDWESDDAKSKYTVLSHYSRGMPCCSICNERDLTFLSIDHINGKGVQHRKEIKSSSGTAFYRWLRKSGFPSGFRTLCMNCQFSVRGRISRLRKEIVQAYGGRCECCGKTEVAVLSIDHVDRKGAIDRKQHGSGTPFYNYLKKTGFPKDGLRLLCMNCQFGFRYGKICPHQIERQSQDQ